MPLFLRTPGFSRLLSLLALQAARERIAPPPTGTAVSDPNGKEEPGGQRCAEMTTRTGTKDGHCPSLLLDDNWFWPHKMTPAPKWHNGKHQSRAAAGADPPGKYKWPAAPPPA